MDLRVPASVFNANRAPKITMATVWGRALIVSGMRLATAKVSALRMGLVSVSEISVDQIATVAGRIIMVQNVLLFVIRWKLVEALVYAT
jgi:hypothetical protein